MKRILVIGAGGAGKSTFSRRLHNLSGLPLIHLDQEYWKPGWVEPDKAQWNSRVSEMMEMDSWIMDGNFGATLKKRAERCDTIIWLDPPKLLCLFRVIKRKIIYRKYDHRPDMAHGCPEKLDAKFLWWIVTFSQNKSGQHIQNVTREFETTRKIVRLTSNSKIEEFLFSQFGASAIKEA